MREQYCKKRIAIISISIIQLITLSIWRLKRSLARRIFVRHLSRSAHWRSDKLLLRQANDLYQCASSPFPLWASFLLTPGGSSSSRKCQTALSFSWLPADIFLGELFRLIDRSTLYSFKVRPNSSEDRNIEKNASFGDQRQEFQMVSEIPGSYYLFSMPGISKSSYS